MNAKELYEHMEAYSLGLKDRMGKLEVSLAAFMLRVDRLERQVNTLENSVALLARPQEPEPPTMTTTGNPGELLGAPGAGYLIAKEMQEKPRE